MPRISHLKSFLEAATCGSFVEASSNLNLSESAVSARIKALEGAIGQRLFHRSKHGVELNEKGRAFLPFAETAVGAWQQGKAVVDAAARERVRVAIGIQQDLWEVFAAEWFAALKQNRPEIQLGVSCDYTDILCHRVAQKFLDIAVIFKPKRMRGVALERLTTLSLVLVSDRNVEWSGNLPANYFYVDWGDDFAVWHDEVFSGPQNPSLNVSVSGMALSAIKKNGGAAYLLENSVSLLAQTDQLFIVDQAPRFDIDVFLARPDTGSRSGIVETLGEINLLRDLMNRNRER